MRIGLAGERFAVRNPGVKQLLGVSAETKHVALSSLLDPQGRYQLSAESLVPGDVVFVQSGDRVPADLRLFRLKELRIEEAILTGESVPVEKTAVPSREDAPLGDRRCLAFSGSLVTYGQGIGVVVATDGAGAAAAGTATIQEPPPR